MRTTISINDHLLAAAKKAATSRGLTLGTLIEEALRRELTSSDAADSPAELPVFTGTGLQPGVNASSNSAIRDMLEAENPALGSYR